MKNKIYGVYFTYKDNYAICHIDNFSEELKKIIREKLSYACYGENKLQNYPKVFNYKSTLKNFMDRIEHKINEDR